MKRTLKRLVVAALFASALLLPLATAYAAPPTGVSSTFVAGTAGQTGTRTVEGIQYTTFTAEYKYAEGPAGGFGGSARADYTHVLYPNNTRSSYGTVTCMRDCTLMGKPYKGSWVMYFIGADGQGQWMMTGTGDLASLHGQGTWHTVSGNAPGRLTGQIHFSPYTPIDSTYENIPPIVSSNEKVVDGNTFTTFAQDSRFREGPIGGIGGLAHMEASIVIHPDNARYYYGTMICFQECTVLGKAYKGSWHFQYVGTATVTDNVGISGGRWILSGTGDLAGLHGEGSYSHSPAYPPSQVTGYVYFDR